MSSTPRNTSPRAGLPYYPPRLVRDLAGTDAVTSEAASIERGYVLHRIDLEKVRVLDARAARCDQDLGVCEQRVTSMAAPPGFWDSVGGRVLLIGLGFLAGMGATAGVATDIAEGRHVIAARHTWLGLLGHFVTASGTCIRSTSWRDA